MMVQFMPWVYSKNCWILQVRSILLQRKTLTAHSFGVRVAILLPWLLKNKWQDCFDDPEAEVFLVAVDGVDCQTWEKHDHPTMLFDKKLHSHKFKHAALKYEIARAIYLDHVVWVNGPFRWGKHNLTILCEGQEDNLGSLLEPIPESKFMVADRGYGIGSVEEMKKCIQKKG